MGKDHRFAGFCVAIGGVAWQARRCCIRISGVGCPREAANSSETRKIHFCNLEVRRAGHRRQGSPRHNAIHFPKSERAKRCICGRISGPLPHPTRNTCRVACVISHDPFDFLARVSDDTPNSDLRVGYYLQAILESTAVMDMTSFRIADFREKSRKHERIAVIGGASTESILSERSHSSSIHGAPRVTAR